MVPALGAPERSTRPTRGREERAVPDASVAPATHIYFLLDRSGSMASIASDVIGGFNQFLAGQRVEGGDCLMTLVQFDSEDPYEVLADACPLAEMVALDAGAFVPRGSTPLYDAMGRLLAHARSRFEDRRAAGQPEEHVVFVTFTDGLENASRELDRVKVFEVVKRGETDGWVFVYLGANQDAYAVGGEVGHQAGNVQNYRADAAGTAAAFASLDRATASYRRAARQGRQQENRADFFGGRKEAEEDLRDPGQPDTR